MRYLTFVLCAFLSLTLKAQINYNDYFTENSLRVDFVFAGNAKTEKIYLQEIKKEPFWSGVKENLLDGFNYGEYKFEIIDKKSGTLIFSRGFCTFFEEWQTIDEAKIMDRSFYQTITAPFPKDSVILNVYSRTWDGDYINEYSLEINPNDYFINPERQTYPNKKIVDNGDFDKKVDLVFLAEGYTETEMDKFERDVQKMIDYLFSQEPYKNYKTRFNVWLVMSPSDESGTDIPGEHIYKRTIMNSNFYTFDSERYLTTEDVFKIRDIASVVPYDDICILVNSSKYGGGGFYNHYCLSSVDHFLSDKVFIHEFGHSFAGLGDEYFDSSTSYIDFFNLAIEPWQPNLTTLKEFDKKWKNMVNKETPVPTPSTDQYKNTVGAYEGGGYVAKGMYRPYIDCRMKSNQAKGFCPVCQDAIVKMILFKSK